MENQVLVIGSTCVDVIIRVDHLPHTEENLIPTASSSPSAAAPTTPPTFWGGGAPVTFVTPVGLQGVFGTFVKSTQTLPSRSPSICRTRRTAAATASSRPGASGRSLSIHGAEYSFNPAWMAPYAAERYAYGYVCGLEIEERPAACWWIISKPPRLIELYASRGAQIAPQKGRRRSFALHRCSI